MRSQLALAGAVLVTTASLTLTVNGLAGSQLGRGTLLTPAAAAEELTPFGSCEELRQWYVDQALPDVGAYGFGDGYLRYAMEDTVHAPVPADGRRPAGDEPAQSSDTGTNVQEAGVDEPDRAKTDGDLVVHLRGRELVVTDVSGAEPVEIGSLPLPRDLWSAELLLHEGTVLVTGSPTPFYEGGPVMLDGPRRMLPGPFDTSTRMLEVSVADPAHPRIESDQTFGGSLVSMRQYDGTVRLVLQTGHPTLDFVFPNRNRTEAEAKAANRQVVRDSTIEDWLPTVREEGGAARPLTDCADVRHPSTGAGFGTLSVVTLAADDPTDLETIGVTAAGDTVYSSADRLYLATQDGARSTEVHAFSLDGPTTTYLASGRVDGIVRDRWSLDEHDGVLRVALAHGRGWTTTDNGITTLEERGDRLVVVGSVRDLGPKEEIQSVRWFDDLAVLVTFRQTDPLYTVDLTDPARPVALGELRIPGFSAYLHPIGGGRLLGLGQDASLGGVTRGGQASLFDIGDVRHPDRMATLDLGARSEVAASYDPRTFTWLPDRRIGLAGLDSWSGGPSVVAIAVSDAGRLSEVGSWPLPRWSSGLGRALPLPGGRVALVGSTVRLVTLP